MTKSDRRLNQNSGLEASNPHVRGGFTVVELLLVVAVLLVACGIVFPPVLRLMADQPLKEAAELARSRIARVRIKALDTSTAWQFRLEPGGRRFLWMPLESVSANAGTAANSTAVTASTSDSADSAPQFGELPKGVTFSADADGVPLAIEHLPAAMVAGLGNGYELTQVGWSLPMTFQPDGSSSDFELAVIDSRGLQIRLTIRGLTGGLTVSSMETRRQR